MNRTGKRTLLFIALLVINTGVDYLVQYGTSGQDVAKHLVNSAIYSLICTAIIFFVIAKVATKPAEKK